jgi:hypothetical protein
VRRIPRLRRLYTYVCELRNKTKYMLDDKLYDGLFEDVWLRSKMVRFCYNDW